MRRNLLFVGAAAFGSLLLPHGPLADDARAIGVIDNNAHVPLTAPHPTPQPTGAPTPGP